MVVITASVHQHILTIVSESQTAAGSRDVDEIRFTFDETWNGWGKEAVFWCGHPMLGPYSVPVRADGTCTIPWKITETGGVFSFAVKGVNGDAVFTTQAVEVEVPSGIPGAAVNVPDEPEPDVYEQLLSNFGETSEKLDDLKQTYAQMGDAVFKNAAEVLTFVLGGVYQADGTTGSMANRVRNLIAYAKKGSSISVSSGFSFSVARYSENSTASFVDYFGFTKEPYYFQSDTYFIVTVKDDEETVWTQDTLETAVRALTIRLVGETKLADISLNIGSLFENVESVRNIGLGAGNVSWQTGGLSPDDGSETEVTNRLRTGMIRAIKGSSVSVKPKSNVRFGVWRYGSDNTFLNYRAVNREPYVSENDEIIRIVAAPPDGQTIQPADAQDLCVNVFCYDLEAIDSCVQTLGQTQLCAWQSGILPVEVSIGDVLPMLRRGNGAWVYQVVACKKADQFHYEGYGGNASKAWAFCDKEFKLLSVTEKTGTTQTADLIAPADGYLICNAACADPYCLRKNASENPTKKDKFDSIFPPQMPEYHISVSALTHSKTSAMTYDEIMAGYDALVSKYPDYVKRTLLGNDSSGSIPMYRYDFSPVLPKTDGNVNVLGHTYQQSNYPTVIMDACIHGAERPCAKALLNLMTLIADANSNDIFGWLRGNIHFVIVPILNVWGYKNDRRGNVNNVDLNRNFPVYWEFGEDDDANDRYRGLAAMSEKETQYMHEILQEYQNNAVCYYSWHTHGLFTGYDAMTCFALPGNGFFDPMQNVGYDVIKSITNSGWTSHALPLTSGLIGFVQASNNCGMSHFDGAANGIASACPEVMYRYYDGGTAEVYNENTDTMNVEYMLYAVCGAVADFLKNVNIEKG